MCASRKFASRGGALRNDHARGRAPPLFALQRNQRGRRGTHPGCRALRPWPAGMGAVGGCRSPQETLAQGVDCGGIFAARSQQPIDGAPARLLAEVFFGNQRGERRHPRTLAHAGTRCPSAIGARCPQNPIDAALRRRRFTRGQQSERRIYRWLRPGAAVQVRPAAIAILLLQ